MMKLGGFWSEKCCERGDGFSDGRNSNLAAHLPENPDSRASIRGVSLNRYPRCRIWHEPAGKLPVSYLYLAFHIQYRDSSWLAPNSLENPHSWSMEGTRPTLTVYDCANPTPAFRSVQGPMRELSRLTLRQRLIKVQKMTVTQLVLRTRAACPLVPVASNYLVQV